MICDAIWVTEYKKVEVRKHEVPAPKYGELLIQTKACGICCWDSFQFRGESGPGPYPYTLGHEATGIVAEIGDGVTEFAVGDKVACIGVKNAQMAEYFTIATEQVAKLPADTTDFVSSVVEPTCTVQNLLNWANINAGDHVVLVGAGYMGQLTLMGLQVYPWGELTVFENNEARLKQIPKTMATRLLNPDSSEGKAYIETLIASGGADHVIEFSAADSGFQLAVKVAKVEQARLTVGSWHRHDMTFDGTRFHIGGFDMHNVSPMTTAHYTDVLPQTMRLVKRGIYKPGTLVTHVADFHDAQEIFERSVDKKDGYLKGVITFA